MPVCTPLHHTPLTKLLPRAPSPGTAAVQLQLRHILATTLEGQRMAPIHSVPLQEAARRQPGPVEKVREEGSAQWGIYQQPT